MTQPLGNLFIIAAPSGAGKSSLINGLIKRYRSLRDAQPDSVQLSVSHTTRGPRPGETNGTEYHFVDHAEFESMIASHDFYEHAKVFDNYYGTSKAAIADKLNQGIDIFLDIDWQGARQVKQLNPHAIGVFILPPSKPVLHERLIKRGQDSDEVISKRMSQAVSEMSHYNEFDYVIVNEDFEQALDEFSSVVQASRMTLSNQQLRHAALLDELLTD